VYYAAFLNLVDSTCTVVGGGKVATRKVQGLLRADAIVTVISPTLTETLTKWAQEGVIRHIPRTYQAGDLAGAKLVFAATNDRAVNQAVSEAAKAAGILANIADAPDECDFILPAVHQHEGIQLAVSTGGKSPALAKHLRDALAQDVKDKRTQFYQTLNQRQ
jgi:siroheme synthase-like protein